MKIGFLVVPYLVSILISVALGILGFRRWIAPGIIEALDEATKITKNIASFAGMKKTEWTGAREIEKVVAEDLIKSKIPELEALRLFLSPSAWEQVEETIQENPEAVIQLWEKYGHLLGGASQTQEKYMF